MDPVDHHSLVGQVLPMLARGLSPFVTTVLAPLVPAGGDRAELIRKKDAADGPAVLSARKSNGKP